MPMNYVPVYPRAGRPILMPVQRLRRHTWRNILIAVLLLCYAGILLFQRADALDWKVVPSDSGDLILKAPGLPERPYLRKRAEEGWNIYENAQWETGNTSYPKADLFLVRMKKTAPSTQHFVKSAGLDEQVKRWFSTELLTLGRSYTIENLLGEIELQFFTRGFGAPCVAVEQGISTFPDSIDFDSGAKLLGNIIIRGWYCAPAESPGAEDSLLSFARGIGLKGFADPRKK